MNVKDGVFLRANNYETRGILGYGPNGVSIFASTFAMKQNFVIKKIPKNKVDGKALDAYIKMSENGCGGCYFWDFDMLSSNDSIFIITKYKPNILKKLMDINGLFNDKQIICLAYEIIKCINEFHKNGFPHKNVKPTNFSVGADNSVSTTDFTICNSIEDIENCLEPKEIIYKAPEHLMKGSVDLFRADVWSYGVLVYYLCTNVLPFQSTNRESYIQEVTNKKPNLSMISNMGLAAIVGRCLQRDPMERPTVDEIMNSPLFTDFKKNEREREHVSERGRFIKIGSSVAKCGLGSVLGSMELNRRRSMYSILSSKQMNQTFA